MIGIKYNYNFKSSQVLIAYMQAVIHVNKMWMRSFEAQRKAVDKKVRQLRRQMPKAPKPHYEYIRKYRAVHPEKAKEMYRAYYQRHKEEKARKYREKVGPKKPKRCEDCNFEAQDSKEYGAHFMTSKHKFRKQKYLFDD